MSNYRYSHTLSRVNDEKCHIADVYAKMPCKALCFVLMPTRYQLFPKVFKSPYGPPVKPVAGWHDVCLSPPAPPHAHRSPRSSISASASRIPQIAILSYRFPQKISDAEHPPEVASLFPAREQIREPRKEKAQREAWRVCD